MSEIEKYLRSLGRFLRDVSKMDSARHEKRLTIMMLREERCYPD